jgi:carboxymethylenebutenolidase
MSQTIQIDVGGDAMDLYVAGPDSAGPHPAVLVCFHRGGMDAFTRERVDLLAEAGYVAVAPDFYHRRRGESAEEAVQHRRDEDVIADIAAAVGWLHAQNRVDDGRIAIMGHCMGGRVAFLGACALPDAFAGVVTYYGGGMFSAWGEGGPTAFERLPALRCPVVGFYGNDDTNPSPEQVDRIRAELKRLGIPYEVHRYDGTGHAFQGAQSPEKYREGPAKESWARTVAWLGETV